MKSLPGWAAIILMAAAGCTVSQVTGSGEAPALKATPRASVTPKPTPKKEKATPKPTVGVDHTQPIGLGADDTTWRRLDPGVWASQTPEDRELQEKIDGEVDRLAVYYDCVSAGLTRKNFNGYICKIRK